MPWIKQAPYTTFVCLVLSVWRRVEYSTTKSWFRFAAPPSFGMCQSPDAALLWSLRRPVLSASGLCFHWSHGSSYVTFGSTWCPPVRFDDYTWNYATRKTRFTEHSLSRRSNIPQLVPPVNTVTSADVSVPPPGHRSLPPRSWLTSISFVHLAKHNFTVRGTFLFPSWSRAGICSRRLLSIAVLRLLVPPTTHSQKRSSLFLKYYEPTHS